MLTQFRLADRAFDAAAALSHGQQQWLEIAMALAGKPKLLLLDEPTGGMSLEERRVTGELLQPIKKHCSLVIVEHDLDFIRDICDRLTVLDQGKVLASGTVSGDPGQQARPGDLSAPCLTYSWTSSISTPAMAAARSCSTSTSAFPGAAASPCWGATVPARPR